MAAGTAGISVLARALPSESSEKANEPPFAIGSALAAGGCSGIAGCDFNSGVFAEATATAGGSDRWQLDSASAAAPTNRTKQSTTLIRNRVHLAASMISLTGVPTLGINPSRPPASEYFSSFIVSEDWQTVSSVTG